MHYMVKRLTSESLRPVIELGIFPGCNALIDTGVEIPVWTREDCQLVRHLKLRGNDGNMYVFSQRTRQKESA